MFKVRGSSLLTSPHFNFILMLEDNERGAYKVEAEAGLRFGVLVGRSWGNWCTHGTGVSRSGLQKSSQMEKEGGGCPWSDSLSLWGGAFCSATYLYAWVRWGTWQQDGDDLPFPRCWRFWLRFSIVQPAINPQQCGAPFLPLKAHSVLENLKLFQNLTCSCVKKKSFIEKGWKMKGKEVDL